MSSTTNLTLDKPANNSDVNTWDVPVNSNMDILDAMAGGHTSLSATAASGVVALTATQYRPRIIIVTGVLTAAVNYQLPSGVGGTWAVFNNTTGAFALTWSSAGGGTSVVLSQGFTTAVICDGTNVGLLNTAVGTAGGSNTQVQYNSASLLTGSSNFTYDGTTLTLKGVLALAGATSGAFGVSVPAVAGAVTYVLPANAGSNGQFLTSDGTGNLTWTGATGGVTSFSAGTTGFTPSTGTGGAVTLSGTLGTANGGTGLTAFTAGKAVYATSTSALTTGTLPVAGGGTGLATTPSNGQVLIGNGAGFALAALTAGSGITVTNGAGTITIASAGTAGTVTSVGASGGSTGMTFTGSPANPVTTSGTLTLTGTLVVANGGTGAVDAATARANLAVAGTGVVNTFSALQTLSAGADNTPATVPSVNAVGYLGRPLAGGAIKAGNYTTTMADCGKNIVFNASAVCTIDSNANVPMPVGTELLVSLAGGGSLAITSDTMRWLASSGATGTRAFGIYGYAYVIKISTTEWYIYDNANMT